MTRRLWYAIVSPMFLGDKIRSVRETMGMSQERLAQLAGTSTRTIARIEAREVTPREATLERIAEALDLDPFRLRTLATDSPEASGDDTGGVS